jgi:hypothetical protein
MPTTPYPGRELTVAVLELLPPVPGSRRSRQDDAFDHAVQDVRFHSVVEVQPELHVRAAPPHPSRPARRGQAWVAPYFLLLCSTSWTSF